MSDLAEERRHPTAHQVIGTISGLLNLVLMFAVLLGGIGAFYELKSSVTVLSTTLNDLRITIGEMNRQIALLDERVRKVEQRTR